MNRGLNKIKTISGLSEIKNIHPNQTIVHCHGVFDVLHAGHLAYFESAKSFGNILIVTLTTDKYVNKGPGRPYYSENIRARMIAALEVVDYVAVNTTATAEAAIEAIRPDFYVKGPDYKDLSKDVTGGIYREQVAVEKVGGQLVFTDDATMSSSTLINKFFTSWSEDQTKVIDAVKAIGGIDAVNEALDKMAKLNIRIIGEPIVDTYIFCAPENISSKNPCISAKYMYEENYAGGSLAIANHLSDFCNSVEIMFTCGDEPYFQKLLKDKMDSRVKVTRHNIKNVPTPRKTRYLAIDSSQRMFEITDLRHDQWKHHPTEIFCKEIAKSNSSNSIDAHIIADFGHGLFESEVLQTVEKINGFVALNVQTNSSNFGFNPFTKHKKFSYLCIDTREARVAYHDRYTTAIDLAKIIHKDLKQLSSVSITLGSNGSYYFPKDCIEESASPAFSDKVVDATGAGDAYFAMSSLLVKINAPEILVPFMGNIFAGLKTKIIGNKNSVSRAEFIKAIHAILK